MGRFRDALAPPGLGAIAEVKRRSPSAGELRPDADPARARRGLRARRRGRVSVLVDERFGGSLDDLRARARRDRLPLLAKGFFTPRSASSRSCSRAGADAVLLLLRDLDDARVSALQRRAAELGLDALVEAHDADELDRAVALGADPIGINARDLDTFAIDRARAARARRARAARPRRRRRERRRTPRAQGAAAELAGADAILVGTALMRAPDPAAKLRELISPPAREGLRADARRRTSTPRVEAGADLRRLHPRAREPAPRAARARPSPRPCCRWRSSSRRSASTAPTSSSSTRARTDHRGRDAVLLRERRAGRARRRPALAGRTTRTTSSARAASRAASCSRAGSRPDNVGERSTPCGRGRSTRARASRSRRGSRTTSACARTWRRRDAPDLRRRTAAATCRRRSSRRSTSSRPAGGRAGRRGVPRASSHELGRPRTPAARRR